MHVPQEHMSEIDVKYRKKAKTRKKKLLQQ